MYFIVSYIIAFTTIFGLSTFGAAIAREKVGTVALISFFSSLLYGFILGWIYWLAQTGFYGPTPLFWGIFFGGIIGAVIAGAVTEEGVAAIPPAAPVVLYVLYAVIIVYFGNQADFFGNSKKKATYIGEVKTINTSVAEFSSDSTIMLEPTDPAHIFLTPDSVADGKTNDALSAFVLADKTVTPGSRYTVGENTVQFVDGQLWHIYSMEFGELIKYNRDKQVPGYLRVSAENPFAKGEPVQYNKQGEEIHIKYLNSAHFANKAERYIRERGYMNAILDDWTFEPDDNWDPYYTVSVLERHAGYAGYTFKGLIVFNVQTGEMKEWKPNEIPSWVDRGIPLDVLDEQITNWAKFQFTGAWQNFFNDAKKQKPTPGWYFSYNKDGYCQWISGITSVAADHALTGFTVSNGRTGKTYFYKKSGVTENLAYQAAKEMWSKETGVVPSGLNPYNLYGEDTYVIPMSFGKQFSGVSLVSMNNKDLKARGKTKEEALREYRAVLARGNNALTIAPTSAAALMVIEGIIERTGTPFAEEGQTHWPFLLKGVQKYFDATYSYKNPEVPFMKAGDKVLVKYIGTDEPTLSCDQFDILTIANAKSGTPEQARYEQAQIKVSAESQRIQDIERKQQLMESDAMKNVTPEELEELLRNKQNK